MSTTDSDKHPTFDAETVPASQTIPTCSGNGPAATVEPRAAGAKPQTTLLSCPQAWSAPPGELRCGGFLRRLA
jgi:hypothetical protein